MWNREGRASNARRFSWFLCHIGRWALFRVGSSEEPWKMRFTAVHSEAKARTVLCVSSQTLLVNLMVQVLPPPVAVVHVRMWRIHRPVSCCKIREVLGRLWAEGKGIGPHIWSEVLSGTTWVTLDKAYLYLVPTAVVVVEMAKQTWRDASLCPKTGSYHCLGLLVFIRNLPSNLGKTVKVWPVHAIFLGVGWWR